MSELPPRSMSSAESTFEAQAVTGRRTRYWRERERGLPWWPWGWLPLIGLALLYLWGAFVTAPGIEDQVESTVTSNLAANGFANSNVSAGGQAVAVDLALPRGEIDHARAVARATECNTWAGQLVCPTAVALSAQSVEPVAANPTGIVEPTPVAVARHHDFSVDVDGDAVRITGEAPSLDARSRLLTQAEERFGNVDDHLQISGEVATQQWPLAATRAIATSSAFERGTVSWRSGSLSGNGLVTAEMESTAQTRFDAPDSAPNLGNLTLSVAKSVDSCNQQFAAALTNSTINFETASAAIDASSQSLLEQLAGLANQCPGGLSIEGHTDSVGGDAGNLTLSQERAAAVLDSLIVLGIATNRLSARGYGESQPIADNQTPEGRAQNRRIVILIADQE